VVVGDFNRDGNLDVALGTSGGLVDLFLGNGDGTFRAPLVFNLGINNSIQSLVAGDFNGDGKLDLAVTSNLLSGQTETGLVTLLLGNGNGTFRRGTTIKVGTGAEGLAAADLNGDGKLDLVTTSMLPDGTRDVKVLLGTGTGTFKAPIILTPGARATSVATGDFNGAHDMVCSYREQTPVRPPCDTGVARWPPLADAPRTLPSRRHRSGSPHVTARSPRHPPHSRTSPSPSRAD
jgi:hypothetical protein